MINVASNAKCTGVCGDYIVIWDPRWLFGEPTKSNLSLNLNRFTYCFYIISVSWILVTASRPCHAIISWYTGAGMYVKQETDSSKSHIHVRKTKCVASLWILVTRTRVVLVRTSHCAFSWWRQFHSAWPYSCQITGIPDKVSDGAGDPESPACAPANGNRIPVHPVERRFGGCAGLARPLQSWASLGLGLGEVNYRPLALAAAAPSQLQTVPPLLYRKE